jgi:GNAT superfamily N-acetyltransferase
VEPRPDPEGFRVREATEADLPGLSEIATRSHGATRFYFDERFPRVRSDAMYQLWVRNGLTEESLRLNVAEADGELLGYHVIRRPGLDHVGNGVLMAVDGRHRGSGVGLGMMNAAAGWFVSLGAESVTTTMQGRSAGVIRLHERLGYLTESVHVWHHRWFDQR